MRLAESVETLRAGPGRGVGSPRRVDPGAAPTSVRAVSGEARCGGSFGGRRGHPPRGGTGPRGLMRCRAGNAQEGCRVPVVGAGASRRRWRECRVERRLASFAARVSVESCSAAGSREVRALEVQGSLREERPVFTDGPRGERRNTG
jgi:hypothetical protein